jgi:glycosyltransferase involved in cell wall biosynthesis
MRVAVLDRNMGVNPYSLGMAEGLRELGHSVLIGTAAGVANGHAFYPRAGVEGRRARKLAETAAGMARAARMLRAFRPDVVHLQWTDSLDRLAQSVARAAAPDAASVVTVHRLGGRTQRQMLARSDAAVAFASSVAEHVDGAHLIPHGNYAHTAEPIPRNASREVLGLPGDRPILAFVGQIRADKGVDVLLRAASRTRDVQVVVAGTVVDAAYRDRLARLEAELGLHVCWIESEHALPAETLVAATCAATAVVLPFVDAVQSGSVIQAMTLGACVVTTDAGDTADTVGADGVVLPAGDEAALAAAIEKLVADPARAQALGRAARETMLAERSWARIGRLLEDVYRQALAARSARARGAAAARVPVAEKSH